MNCYLSLIKSITIASNRCRIKWLCSFYLYEGENRDHNFLFGFFQSIFVFQIISPITIKKQCYMIQRYIDEWWAKKCLHLVIRFDWWYVPYSDNVRQVEELLWTELIIFHELLCYSIFYYSTMVLRCRIPFKCVCKHFVYIRLHKHQKEILWKNQQQQQQPMIEFIELSSENSSSIFYTDWL